MISRHSRVFRVSQQIIKSYAPNARNQLLNTHRNIENCSFRSKHSAPVKNSSFVFNAFLGKVDSTQVVPYPNVLDSDQTDLLKLLLDQAERAINEINDPMKNDELGYVPEKTLEALKASGAYGLQVPEQYGGAELNSTQYGRMTEVMGAHDLGLGVFLTGHQGIGFKGLLICGTDEQKEKYLPQLASGEKMAAFALTEPASGSDASSISTRATLSEDGKFWILNGSKIWITGGGLADMFTVFAKTEVKDEKSGQTKDKITAFFVERSFGGVTNGPPEQKMGIKCSNTAELYFDNTPVPVENVLGGVGNGFKVAMQILNNGRFGMGTSLCGTMRNIICKATHHVSQRVQFGNKLQSFGTIQEKLARMSMYQYANESMAYMVSGTMDSGHQDYQLEAAVSKVFSSEAAWWVTDEAIQILGGMGYMRDTGLEKIMRDLRIFRIFEGTNDILRLFIALTGMQYAGSHLKHLRNAAKNPLKQENMSLIVNEIGRRSIGDNNKINLHPNLYTASRTLCQDITKFGQCVEMLLVKYQKNIIEQQFLLNRVAEVAIDLYVSMSVLSRCSSSLEQELSSAQHEQLMTNLWCREAHTRIVKNLGTLSDKSALLDFVTMAEISRGVCNAGKVVQPNPVGF